MALRLCLVSPYALGGSHPAAEHVAGAASALAARGHEVTVLAPSAATRALRSGRRRLRALSDGDAEALRGLAGAPLAVAVGPAVPMSPRGRRRGAGLPIASSANVAQAVADGGFDVVHAHDPLTPGSIATAAVKHARGLTVASFHGPDRLTVPAQLRPVLHDRLGANIDALVATDAAAARNAAVLYPGEYDIVPSGIADAFEPGDAQPGRVVVEWTPDARAAVRALVRLTARMPALSITLLWNRRTRRPLRPYVPPAARGRVHMMGRDAVAERAALLRSAAVFVAAPDGDEQLAWEARACGCAVVVPSSLEPEGPSLPYAPDQPALAAAATARLVDDGDLRARLAAEGVAAAASRRFPAVAAQLEAIYERLRARRRDRRPPVRIGGRAQIHADFHMHTRHSYDCSTDVEALLDHCIAEGLGAVAITDHNEVGGGLQAQALGKPITVIVGEEVKTSQGEVIGLFLRERIAPGLSMADTIDAIQAQGGLVYMPHPFDRLHTIPDQATLLRQLDRIDVFEVWNARLVLGAFNADAARFAAKYNLLGAGGSDAHVLQGIGTAINRLPAFDGPEEFLLAMRHNQILRRPKSLLYLQGLKWVQQVGR
jgi:predicted metal-dependent phosphoesterase TrpH